MTITGVCCVKNLIFSDSVIRLFHYPVYITKLMKNLY